MRLAAPSLHYITVSGSMMLQLTINTVFSFYIYNAPRISRFQMAEQKMTGK